MSRNIFSIKNIICTPKRSFSSFQYFASSLKFTPSVSGVRSLLIITLFAIHINQRCFQDRKKSIKKSRKARQPGFFFFFAFCDIHEGHFECVFFCFLFTPYTNTKLDNDLNLVNAMSLISCSAKQFHLLNISGKGLACFSLLCMFFFFSFKPEDL